MRQAAEAPARAFVGLGSNLGNRRERIRAALEWLAAHPDIELVRHTRPEETAPWGVTDQPHFVNAVAEIRTTLPPHDLLEALKSAERALGRAEGARRWGPREIDLDILLYDDLAMESESLVIPHPQLVRRPFVLEQIIALDSGISHPVLGRPLRSYLTDMKDQSIAAEPSTTVK